MNQFDFLINGPEYEPQLVYRAWTKIWYTKSPKPMTNKGFGLFSSLEITFDF